jgi:hypothetical protein
VDLNATENPTPPAKNEIQKQDKVTNKDHEANKKQRDEDYNAANHTTKASY